MPEEAWLVYDRETGLPYIARLVPQLEAEEMLNELLEGYPADHEWQRRLYAAPWDGRVVASLPGRRGRPKRLRVGAPGLDPVQQRRTRPAPVSFARAEASRSGRTVGLSIGSVGRLMIEAVE